ncbi:MAG: GPW/gp25 family protein [Nitrosopumilus sp.]|nr:GPW/gp25 family protein [Nitrosopumilus sp.]
MMKNKKYLSFPFRIGNDGKTSQVETLDKHIKEELIQLILTNSGERLFLPDFGGDVRKLVFENIDEVKLVLTKAHITESITRWLGHRVELEDLVVNMENTTLNVEIHYRIAGTEDTRILKLQRNSE